jgi:hypothetical protein
LANTTSRLAGSCTSPVIVIAIVAVSLIAQNRPNQVGLSPDLSLPAAPEKGLCSGHQAL